MEHIPLLSITLGLLLLLALVWFLRAPQRPAYNIGEPPPSQRPGTARSHKMLVRDIMSKELITLAPEDSAKRAWRRLQENKVKTLPVVLEGEVIGIIALVDFLKHLGLAWHTLPEDLNHRANIVMEQDVATLMSKPVHTVSADMPIAELAPLLSDTGLRHLPVVNVAGKLIGMVTQSDLIAALAHMVAVQPAEE